jgi:hypothetical protein
MFSRDKTNNTPYYTPGTAFFQKKDAAFRIILWENV